MFVFRMDHEEIVDAVRAEAKGRLASDMTQGDVTIRASKSGGKNHVVAEVEVYAPGDTPTKAPVKAK